MSHFILLKPHFREPDLPQRKQHHPWKTEVQVKLHFTYMALVNNASNICLRNLPEIYEIAIQFSVIKTDSVSHSSLISKLKRQGLEKWAIRLSNRLDP